MKKIFFLFATLASVTASAQVTNVEPVGANYANKTVSFRVWWNAGSRDATHLPDVWVWVDYVMVNNDNTTSGNTWTRALISGTPTANSGTPTREDGNDKGFWLQGNNGSYSTTVTATLNGMPNKFNWCAYVSDYPPNITFSTQRDLTMTGTIPFIITYTDNSTVTVNANNFTLASGKTFKNITDATFCPTYVNNTINGIIPTVGTDNGSTTITCSGSTLYVQSAANGTSPWLPNNYCPVGWRWPDHSEVCCMITSGMFSALGSIWWSSDQYDATKGLGGGYPCQSGYSNVSDCCVKAYSCCSYAGFKNAQWFIARYVVALGKSTSYNVYCVKN